MENKDKHTYLGEDSVSGHTIPENKWRSLIYTGLRIGYRIHVKEHIDRNGENGENGSLGRWGGLGGLGGDWI